MFNCLYIDSITDWCVLLVNRSVVTVITQKIVTSRKKNIP